MNECGIFKVLAPSKYCVNPVADEGGQSGRGLLQLTQPQGHATNVD